MGKHSWRKERLSATGEWGNKLENNGSSRRSLTDCVTDNGNLWLKGPVPSSLTLLIAAAYCLVYSIWGALNNMTPTYLSLGFKGH